MPASGLYMEMSKDSEHRKSDRRRANIENDYRTQLDSLLAGVAELETGADQAARTTRTGQVKHLSQLIARKAEIEGKILKHAEELAAAFFRVREEVEGAVEARMREILEAVEGCTGLVLGLREMGTSWRGRGNAEMEMALDGAGDGAGEKGMVWSGVKRKRGGEEPEEKRWREEGRIE